MELSAAQKQQRANIKNYFLIHDVATLKKELAHRKARKGEEVAVWTLEEMIRECEKAGVDNYGKLPL